LLQLLGVSREDPDGSLYETPILCLTDEVDAWRRAELKLMLQAGPRAMVEHVIGTVTQWDDSVQLQERATHSDP